MGERIYIDEPMNFAYTEEDSWSIKASIVYLDRHWLFRVSGRSLSLTPATIEDAKDHLHATQPFLCCY